MAIGKRHGIAPRWRKKCQRYFMHAPYLANLSKGITMKNFIHSCILIIASFSIVTVTSSSLAQSNNHGQLPPQQIKRFVRTIALIKHYYIKDIDDKTLFSNAIRGMVSNLDPHSSFLNENNLKELKTAVSGKFVGIGIELTTQAGALKVISPLEDTPAERAGIKANDLIIKINGKLVQNMTLHEAVNDIKGKRGTQVTLTILRKAEKQPIVITVTRNVIHLVTVKGKMLGNGFAYIRITFFQGPVYRLLKNQIEALKAEANDKLKGFILDLRNNPGGLLDVSAKVADVFLDAGQLKKYHGLIVYTKGRISGSDMQLKASPGDLIANVPMVVLINSGSASASEIVAGALQDYQRAIILGTRSFGKGSVQTVLPIGEHSAIKLTTALYHTPSGRVIQAEGILPDVVVPNLTVSEKNIKGLLDIEESNYRHHLQNGKKTNAKQLEILKSLRKKELNLAKEDYQLYEALMILKGMNAVKNWGN